MFLDQIKTELRKVVLIPSGEGELETWILSNYQAILDSKDDDAIALANELNALFVEESEGLLSSEELAWTLAQILRREVISVSLTLGEFSICTKGSPTIRKRLEVADQITDVHLNIAAV